RLVASVLLRGSDRSEETVHLVVRAGGEEERVRWSIRRRSEPELQRPEAVDRDLLPVRPPQLSAELEAVRLLLVVVLAPAVLAAVLGRLPVLLALVLVLQREHVDPAVAEVADEQIAAEAAEAP